MGAVCEKFGPGPLHGVGRSKWAMLIGGNVASGPNFSEVQNFHNMLGPFLCQTCQNYLITCEGFFCETVHPTRKGIESKNIVNCICNKFICIHFCSKYHSLIAKEPARESYYAFFSDQFFSETVHPTIKSIKNKNVVNWICNKFICINFCSKYHSFGAKEPESKWFI